MKHVASIAAVTTALVAAGCSTLSAATLHEPEAVRAPAGQVMARELLASGVQLYECVPGKAGGYEWKFRGPEAALMDKAGAPMGKHYGGPTWESLDGSMVVAEVRASAPAPDAIPLLLLSAKSTKGEGTFSKVRSIQRLATAGGRAPEYACVQGDAGRVARVPYTATYRFYE